MMIVDEKLVAAKNNVVSIKYELHLNDKNGELVERVEDNNPFNFIYGTGNMLEKFEAKLAGMAENEPFEFTLTSGEAYGERNEENMAEIPMSAFEVDGKIEEGLLNIGNFIPLRDEAGNHYNGKVLSVGKDVVKLDFNHPLAGQTLHFTGAVLAVRKATEEELAHGHVHEPGHHHHHGHDHEHGNDGCDCGPGCECN
jgi:FKBP-type peptidyl-prolyl cis-trans isomerase SlyD